MTTPVIGIDVSKQVLDIVVVGHRCKSKPYVQVKNTAAGMQVLLKWLDKQHLSACRVCMEATGRYYELVALTLHQSGYEVCVVNPAQIKAYGQSQLRRNKTDKLDASLIADFGRTQSPPAWQPLSPQQRELQQLVRYRDAMVTLKQQQRNRRAALSAGSPISDLLTGHLTAVTSHLNQIETLLRQHMRRYPDLRHTFRLLTSITGIGEKTAWHLMSEVPDLRRFSSAAQLVAYAGLNPRQRQSGNRCHPHTPISKQGNRRLRRGLYMAGIVAKNRNPLIMPLAQRMIAHGKAPQEAVVAAMRKLLCLAFGVIKSDRPFDPLFVKNRL